MSASDTPSRRVSARSTGQRSTGNQVPATKPVSNGEARPPPAAGRTPFVSLATDQVAVIGPDRRFKHVPGLHPGGDQPGARHDSRPARRVSTAVRPHADTLLARTELVALARQAVGEYELVSERHQFLFEAPTLEATVDEARVQRVLANLPTVPAVVLGDKYGPYPTDH